MRVHLETERMWLREFTSDDVDALVELDSDPAVMRFITGGRPTPRAEVEREVLPAFLDYYRRTPGFGFWAAIDKAGGEFLGWFHFRPGEGHGADEPELGYRLRRAAWGRGYAAEGSRALIDRGFADLGVRRVLAETMVVNTASRRVMEKAGLSLLRVFHADWPHPIPGDEHGDVEYELTRTDWVRTRVAGRMAVAVRAWLAALTDEQRDLAHWPAPGADADTEAERIRWYYTPTDHGGLPLGAQGPAQQRRALQLVASGLSPAGYATVSTVLGLENVLDHVEGFSADWGRERGRDPGLYYLRAFGDPERDRVWGWRFGGHHVSLNYLVVDGRVRSSTPCFLGADPATFALLGPATLRPLGGVEDLARELVRSLDPEQAARAILLDRAPSDLVAGNRSRVADGDQLLRLPEVWRGRFSEPRLAERVMAMGDAAERASGYDAADHAALALTTTPKGLPASELDSAQRAQLRALLATYLGRVPDGLAPAPDDSDLDLVHLAWAGPTEPGQPHYYRLQGPGLLVEYDNTQRQANHAHSVWRDPEADFGADVLRAHLAQPHPRS